MNHDAAILGVLPADLADRLPSPALVIRRDRARENARRVVARLGGADRWRPHLKTTKIPALWRDLADLGVRHVKCATTREAAVALATFDAGLDLLVAYPHVGPALDRLAALAAAHPEARIAVLVEDPAAVDEVPAPLAIFADLDAGMHRTGLDPARLDDLLAIARAAGARFRGLHWYDGQLAGEPGLRRAVGRRGYDRLLELRTALLEAGIAVGELVTSGTPALDAAAGYDAFAALDGTRHRASPGTVVLHDQRTASRCPELDDLVPAAFLFTRVVSRPRPDVVTVDAGSKSIATDAGHPCARVLGRPDLEPLIPSEEHLPIRVAAGGAVPPRGAALLLVPAHVCPCVNLAEEAILLEADGSWNVEPVAARGHEGLAIA